MFTINDDMSIYVTRGDIAFFTVTAEKDGLSYKFQAGDVVRIKVMQKKACDKIAFQKDFPIEEETETVEIFLTEAETKIGNVISKPVDYWYEVELNPLTNPQTIIGYDDDGAKIFKLFPEGRDIDNSDGDDTEIKEEDIPIVDKELDLTSERPVENRAVARAVLRLKSDVKGLLTLPSELEIERARLDNLLSSSTEDGEVIDIRVGFDGKTHASAGRAVREQIKQVLSAASLKDGIHIYPSRVSQYGITISGASLRQNTRYRLEYKDVYESGILIENVKYLYPNDGMDLEWPAELVDGCYEFTTGNKVCKEIYIDLSGDSWDGTYETAVALMDGIFLFNAEAMELSNSLDELATIFSSAVAKDGVPLIYYTHAEDSITTISVLLKANTKYAVEYNSLLTPDISVDAVRLFDLVESSTTEIKGADNVFTFETGSNNRLMLDLVVSGDGWDASKDTALQVIGGITVCRASCEADEAINALMSNYYNKKEVEDMIVYLAEERPTITEVYKAIAANSLRYVIVAELPTDEEKIDENVVYMVSSNSSDGNNKYIEWLYSNGSWEMIGTTSVDTDVDLDGYYKKNEIDDMLDDLKYVPISILEFNNLPKSAEIGSTVNDVSLYWILNKQPRKISIDGVEYPADSDNGTVTIQEKITGNKTWSLSVSDERGATHVKSTSISFLNSIYYGVASDADLSASPTYDAFITSLNKILSNSKSRTIEFTAGEGQRFYYAVPTRLGDCSFNVGGFDGGFGKLMTLDITNASGYTESYDLYRSNNANLGVTTVRIS